MSATFAELKTSVSTTLRDPDGKTFDDSALGEIVNVALAEIGRIMPEMFQEDITPVADTLSYVLRSGEFGGVANPEIEVARVELWDGTTTPATRMSVIEPASSGIADSEAGWVNWGGTLYLPSWVDRVVDGAEDDHLIRVWGYSPYANLTADADVCSVSNDAKYALLAYARLEAIERLIADRNLFTQWQTRSGNTDISPAGLMNEANHVRDDWRRKSRNLLRLRSAV